jgi:hypothetical protein
MGMMPGDKGIVEHRKSPKEKDGALLFRGAGKKKV